MRSVHWMFVLLVGCAGAGTDGGDGAVDDGATSEPEASACETLEMTALPFDAEGPYGVLRRDLADDFTVEDQDGDWTLSEEWSGCETYLFIPDAYTISSINGDSIWTRDLLELIERSPNNVHYFFVSMEDDNGEAKAARQRIEAEIEDALDQVGKGKKPGKREWWRDRLHVVQQRIGRVNNWVATAASGSGEGASTNLGFGIDRFQRIRGIGSLSDVNKYNSQLAAEVGWGWEANIAYFAHEALYYNYEAERQAILDSHEATVVRAWDGVVLAEYAETEVTFPAAEELAGFDTAEIDLIAYCPSLTDVEFNNCGAWDYIADVKLLDEDGVTWHELARWITTYHREGRYLVDITPMMPRFAGGGTRTIRYSFAPSWNTQPTETVFDFRFTNQGKGYRPIETHTLFSGGSFGSAYNEGREPVEIEIPASATRVETVAIITGHGMDNGNCAEFCNHEHELTVNGQVLFKDFPEVGDDEGCVNQISEGTVPNQAGTWWFGRGGWCPGKQVDPWVEDVTAAVTPGTTATVSYRGLYRGDTPPDGSGNITMTSVLTVYE